VLAEVLAFGLVAAACWAIYRLSPPTSDDVRTPLPGTVMRVSDAREAVSWQPGRRYLVARVLRTPVRHHASVTRHRDLFQAACPCGWQGTWQAHQGDAFAEAHLHTRYINAAVRGADEADGESGADQTSR
jgi:hypothetical protein